MIIKLRGHHLLCLLGFRGMGYSPEFCVNMTKIYETLRSQPETEIEIVEGPDDICAAFPIGDQRYHCENHTVLSKDAGILERLGIKLGSSWKWADILVTVAAELQPQDIGIICATCPWEHYGVCAEGVRLVTEGRELPPIKK
ncbi:DUF1284 domain-containing protein [Paenibacillus hexagrammi]|uniref:DUF1284 domain-containing protein n=1 Tax=Paenibacillus hexagrammi TaxID=2908839 RepID=A0ABY3SLG1_9BACL|nr:DUF1284 domain-containing protein [Paenibacillus sp. YPD9-1]UJF34059.1 DUF1284 domain-containing protein [Paenibacillus sp. YPD9-1]